MIRDVRALNCSASINLLNILIGAARARRYELLFLFTSDCINSYRVVYFVNTIAISGPPVSIWSI